MEKVFNFIKKINFKEGFRRLILFLIGSCVLLSFAFVQDQVNLKFKQKFLIEFEKDTEASLELTGFKLPIGGSLPDGFVPVGILVEKGKYTIEEYGNRIRKSFRVFCNAYERTCHIDGVEFKDSDAIYTGGALIMGGKFIMPDKLMVFWWTILQALLHVFYGIIAYLLYLLLEFIVLWIFRGFKLV